MLSYTAYTVITPLVIVSSSDVTPVAFTLRLTAYLFALASAVTVLSSAGIVTVPVALAAPVAITTFAAPSSPVMLYPSLTLALILISAPYCAVYTLFVSVDVSLSITTPAPDASVPTALMLFTPVSAVKVNVYVSLA